VRFYGTGIRELRRTVGTVTVTCPQCQRSCSHGITSQRTWITILFVGVLPLGRQYFTVCSGCRLVARIEKSQAESLLSSSS
jgi:hypothetical protein